MLRLTDGRKSKSLRKEIQAGSEGNPRKTGRKSKFIPSISFAESSLFKNLRRPPQNFFFLKPIPALAEQALRVRPDRSSVFGLRFRFPRSL
jgi:hypothetical protein